MTSLLKKLINSTILNSCIFIMLIIGIQNSGNKSRANFLINETVDLPISFIIGSSIIAGSMTGSLLSFINYKED